MIRYLWLALVGAVVGALIGYFQPEIHNLSEVTSEQRLTLSLQMALPFAMIFIVIDRYLNWRRRILERLTESRPKA